MRALRWCSMALVGVCVLALIAGVGRSQQLGNGPALKSAFTEAESRRLKLAASGSTEKLIPSDKKVADALAKWYLYRITHKGSFDPAKVQAEFATFVGPVEKKSPPYQEFIDKHLGPAMVSNMKDVLTAGAAEIKDQPSIYVNACLMLPTMARLRANDIGEFLVTLVNDKDGNEIARLNALRGLKEFMPINVFNVDSDVGVKPKEDKRALDAKSVASLTKYIERPIKVSGLVQEQIAVVHFFRREAIVSLAQGGAPAVLVDKKAQKIESPVAPTLLLVLAGKIEPTPTLQEKIEAAIGVCALKYDKTPEYMPEVAVYLVGLTLKEAVTEYNTDLLNFTATGKDRILPKVAWKTESKNLEIALKNLKLNATAPNVKAGAERLETIATKGILQKMQKYQQPDDNDVFELGKAVQLMKPSGGAVFKNLKASPVIPLP